MSQSPKSSHLIERAAERLRGGAGLPAMESAAPSEPEAASTSFVASAEQAPADAALAERVLEAVGAASEEARPRPAARPDALRVDLAPRPAPAAAKPAGPPVGRAALEAAGLVVGPKRTRISEEFRVTITRVVRSMRAARPGHGASNMIMVTSAKPGEGKSFTALNLAASVAEHGLGEAILVDTDAKLRPLTDQLGLTGYPGLLDLALNPSLRLEDTVVRTSIAKLAIVPVGSNAHERTSPAVPPSFHLVAERLGRKFPNHIIVLDAPPCLSTSDPTTLAPLVGQIVMVVEAARTQKNEVEAALDLVRACPNITLLLNKIQLTMGHTFGAYHYFGTYT